MNKLNLTAIARLALSTGAALTLVSCNPGSKTKVPTAVKLDSSESRKYGTCIYEALVKDHPSSISTVYNDKGPLMQTLVSPSNGAPAVATITLSADAKTASLEIPGELDKGGVVTRPVLNAGVAAAPGCYNKAKGLKQG